MIRHFLIGKMIPIGFFSLLLIFTSVFFLLIEIPIKMIFLFCLITILLVITWLGSTYTLEQRKFKHLQVLMSQLEEPYLLGTILPKPTSAIEYRYFEILQSISHDAISKVELEKKLAKDYKEYVEVWIHELKTPLTAMNLILSNDGDTRKLRRELKRADNLTDNILHYARLQTIEKDKQLSSFSIAEILNQAVKNQMDLLIGAKMQIEIDGDFTVYSDQKAVQFIINQLLINSVKYAPQCKISFRCDGNQLIYEDNGTGMDKHELPRIFDRGFTGANGRKLGTSTGMGLYIVANLCKELNITYEVQSEVNKYTKFTFTFPNLTEM